MMTYNEIANLQLGGAIFFCSVIIILVIVIITKSRSVNRFKKLRPQMKRFAVVETYSLFGRFSDGDNGREVMARSHHEAVKRLIKRKHEYDQYSNSESLERWARYKVVLKESPYKRNTKFFR